MRRTMAFVALWTVVAVGPLIGDDRDPLTPRPGRAKVTRPEETASVGGKYRTLLRQIRTPEDFVSYRYFRDYGHYTGSSWRGHNDLPPGYWVYLYPHWYIWGECSSTP